MDQHVHLKLAVQSLTLAGFWPIKIKHKCLGFLYTAYFLTGVSVFVVFVLTQFVEMYLIMDKSLEEISGLMAINFLYTLGLVKLWVVGRPGVKKLIKKIQVTETNIFKYGDKQTIKIFQEHVAKNYNANRLMISLGLLCYFMFISTPFLVSILNSLTQSDSVTNATLTGEGRPLPLVSWIPFDTDKYYNTAFTWHAIAGYFNTSYIVALNNTFFGLMIFVTGQIKILQYSLMTFAKDTDDELTVKENLRKCIICHNSIIRFTAELDAAMRFFLLLDFAACALQISMIGFEIVVAELSVQLIKNTIYLGSMIIQLFLFYWHGNEVRLESTRVTNAIWESAWYKCSVSANKTLLLIIMRAQRPLKLSVGSFYQMSIETMVTILKSGYTYAALMQQLYSRKID